MTMKGSVSSSKRKSSKKRNLKTPSASKKKKSKGKEFKKRRHDSVSSFSDSSSSSLTDYRRRKVKKSKRRQQRDYSISSCSDDDRTGSDSLPTRKNKKPRSLNRVVRKRYSSPESDGDARRVKKTKRKRSTGDRDGKRKKKSLTKKSKRDLSPDSLSCSTCPSKSSSSAVDGKSERSKQIDMETEFTREKDREVTSPYMPPVNNSNRLRSVINVAYQPDEDDRWDGNLRDEDIFYEMDNYTSPISLDSNEVGGKREIDDHSRHGIPNERIKLERVTSEEETELGKTAIHDDPRSNNFEEKETNMSSPAVAAVEGDNNMELILKQKALENFRKFKASRLQTVPQCITNVKTNNENDVPSQSTKQATTPQTQLTNLESGFTVEKDSSPSEVKKHPMPEGVVVEPGAVKQNIISVTTSDNNNNQGIAVAQSSVLEPLCSPRPISGQHTLEEERGEVNDGPEFEQKTMSVMSGGEMVQVTYKVKIPKRAPALARRQLKR